MHPHSDKLWEPLLPSLWNLNKKRRPKLAIQENGAFLRALKYSLRSVPVLEIGTPDGTWLAALIHLEAINCAGWLDHINGIWSKICDNADSKEQQQLSMETSELCKTMQSDISQVVALQRTPSVHIRHSDYEEPLLMLERLLGEAKVIAADIRESLDMQHRVKNTQVAELAINESRSAIAGTFSTQRSHNSVDIADARTLFTCSHRARIRIYPNQSSFVRIRNERARNQRHRPQHLGIPGNSFSVADSVRPCVDGVAGIAQLDSYPRRSRASLASYASDTLARNFFVLADA